MSSAERRDEPLTAGAEWRRHWPLVLTAAVGISLPSVMVFSLGQFMQPLETAFGWSRMQTSMGISASALTTFALSGFVGRLVDRIDIRRLALCGVMLCSLAIAGFSLLPASLAAWLALWIIFALTSVLIGPTVWLAAVMGVFKHGRNLPMTFALCGNGIASALSPIVTRFLIDTFGWRGAYAMLGAVWGGTALLLSLAFFFDRREKKHSPAQDGPVNQEQTPVRALIFSASFAKLAVAVFAMTIVITGGMINLSPLLVDGGLSRAQAAATASLAGLGAIAVKPITGLLFDNLPSRVATTCGVAILALACFLLLHTNWSAGAALGCFAFGASAGAMTAIMACASGQVFKAADFGTAFGSLISVMSLSSFVAPVLAGAIHDSFKSYNLLLWIGIAIAAGTALLLATLSKPQPG